MKRSLFKFKWGIVAILLVACVGKNSEISSTSGSNIIMINARKGDKEVLARLLDRIGGCQPKVVGINFYLRKKRDMTDTLLANSIARLQNVVLVSSYQNNAYFRSDPIFRINADGEGIVDLGLEDEQVTKQMVFISINDELKWSFPMTVASFYDADKSVATMHGASVDQYYEIDYVGVSNDFKVLDVNDSTWGCDLLTDKIVLVGFLGPEDNDTYAISGGVKKYSTWILGNCIKDILDGHFVSVD